MKALATARLSSTDVMEYHDEAIAYMVLAGLEGLSRQRFLKLKVGDADYMP